MIGIGWLLGISGNENKEKGQKNKHLFFHKVVLVQIIDTICKKTLHALIR